MNSDQEEINCILKEARRICLEQSQGLTVSDLLKLDDGYLVVISHPVFPGHEQGGTWDAMREITPRLLSITGVKRVTVEIVRKA